MPRKGVEYTSSDPYARRFKGDKEVKNTGRGRAERSLSVVPNEASDLFTTRVHDQAGLDCHSLRIDDDH
jgi:hypothetical protein